ncbi:MAG: hypothetical protein G01um101433_504 [Parcubacteria group bacterium Gr01-1014_33]|nr:MAG: hypothetical protein G01um101433_504 [Parcubacteria group bacterium Gr01-1014_33]
MHILIGTFIVFFSAFVFRHLSRLVGVSKRKFLRLMGISFLCIFAILLSLQNFYFTFPRGTTPEDITYQLVHDPEFPEKIMRMRDIKNTLWGFIEITFLVGLAPFLLSFTSDLDNEGIRVQQQSASSSIWRRRLNPILMWSVILIIAIGLFIYAFGGGAFLYFLKDIPLSATASSLFFIIVTLYIIRYYGKKS